MKHYALVAVLLLTACATTKEVIETVTAPVLQVQLSDAPICSKPPTGNQCIDDVERDYCGKMKELAPEVQEIVQHDVLCAQYDDNVDKLGELNCYKDDTKAVAAMKLYWDKPEGQALVYYPTKYEKAKAACK